MSDTPTEATGFRALIITNIHANPYLVLQQLQNYQAFHGGNAIHLLHESREAKAKETFKHLYPLLEGSGIEFDVVRNPGPTSYGTCLGGVLSAWSYAKNEMNLSSITHVYWHTDSDLLIHGDFNEYIGSNSIGLPPTIFTPKLVKEWHFFKAAESDQKLTKFINHYDLQSIHELRNCRIEGIFMPTTDWDRMMTEISKFYSIELIEGSVGWPAEEVIIPTIAERMFSDRLFSRNTVYTPFGVNRDTNIVSIEDIDGVLKKLNVSQLAGIKWFSKNPNCAPRSYAQHLAFSNP